MNDFKKFIEQYGDSTTSKQIEFPDELAEHVQKIADMIGVTFTEAVIILTTIQINETTREYIGQFVQQSAVKN